MHRASTALTAIASLLLSCSAFAQHSRDRTGPWIAADLGTGTVTSLSPAPSSERSGLAASIEVGYRVHPAVGLGLELGTLAPIGGCANWPCGTAADFSPSFGRLMAFGTWQPRAEGWNLRAGLGVSRFCHQRHWSPNAWSWLDTVIAAFDDDYLYASDGSGAWRCDAREHALGGSVSVGYDWRLPREAPVSIGLRLSAEAANFAGNRAVDIPAFRHRAVMLTLRLRVD